MSNRVGNRKQAVSKTGNTESLARLHDRIRELELLNKKLADKAAAYQKTITRLRESQKRYRTAIENSNDGVAIIRDTVIVYVNKRYSEMFGYGSTEELLGQSFLITVHPDDADRLMNIHKQRQLGKPSPNIFEFKGIKKNGEAVDIETSTTTIVFDGHRASLAYLRDISERKRTEEALRRSEEVLRKILDNSYDAVFIHDVDGKIIDVNNKMLQLYGVDKEQALSFSIIDDYSTPDNATESLKGIWENIIAGGNRLFEWKARRPLDGSTFDVEVYLTKITMQKQDLVLATVRDITERKKLERHSALQRNMALELAQSRSLDHALSLCLETAIELSGMDSGGIYLEDRRTGDFVLAASKNLTEWFRGIVKSVPVNSVPWKLTMLGNPLYLTPDDPEISDDLRKIFSGENIKSIAVIPIKQQDRIIGCFNVTSRMFDEIPSLQRNLLETMVVHISNVIWNLRISEDLAASERKYRNIFENAAEGIFQTTRDGKLLDANPAYARIYGYDSPLELLQTVDNIGNRLYARPAARTELLSILEQQDVVRDYIIEGCKKNGDSIWVSLNMRTIRDDSGNILHYEGTATDITQRKKAEDELKIKSINLEEVNAALKVLLKQREQDKNELEEKVLKNMKELVFPYLEKIRETHLDDRQKIYIDIIVANLENIASPFIQRITRLYSKFTPTEIKIANLIREGKTVKDISKILGVSPNSVNLHRQNIRNKLGLNNKKLGLKTYLMSFS